MRTWLCYAYSNKLLSHVCTHIDTDIYMLHTSIYILMHDTHVHTHIHMNTCTYIYTWAHTHMYTHVLIHAHTHMHTHSCIYMHMHTFMHIYTHADMHTCRHAHTHAYIYTHVYTHAHIYTGAHIHMYTYIHTYTHMHTLIYTYTHHTHAPIHICTYMHTHLCIHIHTCTYAHVHRHIHTVWQLLHFQFSVRDRGRQKARSESLVLQLPWALPLGSLYHRRTEASLGSCLSSPPCFSGPCPIIAHRRYSEARLSLCPFSIHRTTSPIASLSQAGLQIAHMLILPLTLLFPQQRDTPQTSVPTAGKPLHL